MKPILNYLLHYLSLIESLRHRLLLQRIMRLAKEASEIDPRDLNELILIFTCDMELTPPFTHGTWHERDLKAVEELPALLEELDKTQVRGTFYTEGILCEKVPEMVSRISKEGHEVGCHGYAHESYGGYWRTPECVNQPMVLQTRQRRVRIEIAVKLIKSIVGYSPISFKAPFDIIDGYTLSLLQTLNFRVDSSLYNYAYGKFSIPYHPDVNRIDRVGNMEIYELPFTVSPIPKRKWFFSCKFDPIARIYGSNVKHALFLVGLIRRVQTLLGYPVSVIMLTSHPWEFSIREPLFKDEVFGKKRLKAFSNFLEEVLSTEDTRSRTVKNFIQDWQMIIDSWQNS